MNLEWVRIVKVAKLHLGISSITLLKLLQNYSLIACACVCVCSFHSFLFFSSRGVKSCVFSTECKIDKADFTYWIIFSSSTLWRKSVLIQSFSSQLPETFHQYGIAGKRKTIYKYMLILKNSVEEAIEVLAILVLFCVI